MLLGQTLPLEGHVVLEGVVVVGDHAVEQSSWDDLLEISHRITTDTDIPNLALLDLASECRQGFIDDLLHICVFDVMAKNHVKVIKTHALERDVDAFSDSLGGEIEMLRCVSPKFRTDDERLATICR